MRIAVAALCVLALTGSAEADYVLKGQYRAPCKQLPPIAARQEPNVPYRVYVWSQSKVQRVCGQGKKLFQPITACSMRPGTYEATWVIATSSFLSKTDGACVMLYEKSHLPPNDWLDQAWEDAAFKGIPYK